MKKNFKQVSLLLMGLSFLMVQCKKVQPDFIGTESKADFIFYQKPGSDTLPYPLDVAFTSKSTEAFLYQWSFGDNSALSSQENPIHTYKAGGTFNVTLTTIGTNGNSNITKVVSVMDACSNDLFKTVTNCSDGEWNLAPDDDAIKLFYPDGVSVESSQPANDCQLDDVFKFSSNGEFTYDANGGTYNYNVTIPNCGAAMANATDFKLVLVSGNAPKFIMGDVDGAGSPFLGSSHAVLNNAYEIMSYTTTTLLLKATLASNNHILYIKLKKKTPLTLNGIKDILTGGSSRAWKLDPTPGANSIIVGTEGNPAEYYGGGPLEPNCQTDDIYTFSSNGTVAYNANGSTFNGGNIAPNYNCGADRSFNSAYDFGAVVGGVDGVAQIQLPGAPPAMFIGTTDVPTENLYRIIEITPSRMVLRAGTGSGVVFQFKFVRQ
jgi:PKD repeat protein